jgi:hypothetical protein
MTSNRLAVLAAEIEQADSKFRRSAEQAATAAVEAGTRLIEAKELVPHGGWALWLSDNVPAMSERTARRYMQIARSGLQIGHVAEMGIRAAAESLARRNLSEDDAPDLFTPPSEPTPRPEWAKKLDELETPAAKNWSSALRALRLVNEQVSVDTLFKDRFTGFDEVFGPELEQAFAWVNQLHARFCSGHCRQNHHRNTH